MDGIINVLKPPGMTSFDVIAVLRRLTRIRKIGHTGTLDPDACGVLPVCIGKATSAVEHLTEKRKTYRAEMVLGVETDTQDASGETVSTGEPPQDDDAIVDACHAFIGGIEQIPPMHSAVKINGRRLYESARAGETIERQPRKATIHAVRVINIRRNADSVAVLFEVSCSKGTYIRTLCHDIGRRLGCGAHMSFLLRTESGPFLLADACTLEAIAEVAAEGDWNRILRPIDSAFPEWSRIDIARTLAFPLGCGLDVRMGTDGQTHAVGDRFRVYVENRFLGLAVIPEEGRLRMSRWLADDPQQWRL